MVMKAKVLMIPGFELEDKNMGERKGWGPQIDA
jgi:hypothetical protein